MTKKHRVEIDVVESSSDEFKASIVGAEGVFDGKSEEEAIGRLLGWLAEQFMTKARRNAAEPDRPFVEPARHEQASRGDIQFPAAPRYGG